MKHRSAKNIVCNEFYLGQGLGNQLWNYTVTRIISEKISCDFSILSSDKFKGANFIKLDYGVNLAGGKSPEGGPPYWLPKGITNYFLEPRENLLGSEIDVSRPYSSLFEIPSGSKIDGNFQSVSYLDGYRDKIRNWICLEKKMDQKIDFENTCVIHVRCGDFSALDSVFLPKSFYANAISAMLNYRSDLKFVCVTDDAMAARQMLPDFVEIVGSALVGSRDSLQASHHVGGPVDQDFLILNSATYSIISNSSFSWWATYLNSNVEFVIAPKYWARYNRSDGFWSTSDIITPGFTYIDGTGSLLTAEFCSSERDQFYESHETFFVSVNYQPHLLKTLKSDVSRRLRGRVRRLLSNFNMLGKTK